MSKVIASAAIRGAHAAVEQAKTLHDRAVSEKGASHPVSFPNTAYFLPLSHAHLGLDIATLEDISVVLDHAASLLPPVPSENAWLPYLGDALDAGMATLFAFEIIEACKTVIGPDPRRGIWLGAADDVIMRERGVEFVDGSAPGFAAIVGAAPDAGSAVKLARELQSKNLYVFMAGNVGGVSYAEQLASKGVQLGWETRLVPFGKETSAAVHALGFASRVAMSFGGVKKGDALRNLLYNKNRTFAFVLALGEVDDAKYAAAAGCINYGFPTIADTGIPQILPSGICTYEHVVSNVPLESIVARALDVRGCKIKITEIPIPVAYGAAFEGERIRKEQVRVEFGGNLTDAFEFCTSKEMDEVDDGAITVIGPEADRVDEGAKLPLAIWVEVAGRKMQPDFEPILERQVHHMINQAEGIWHMGQRDIIWIRIGKEAFSRGFRIRHFGEILRARLLSDYPAIVDKVAVTLYTDEHKVKELIAHARATYRERNQRLASLTDESVDTFYSCLLCQSFAPNHVCVITPERLGLCGAYNWLDGKAAYEIDPTGPNKPLLKGECIDPHRGVWGNVNTYVHANSNSTIEEISMYSIMASPMTSCGCFEVILAVVPELNGVIAVNREFTGRTPLGMKFSTLAGTVGGGQQTPGFLGCGKVFLTSRKFIAAEGGIRRLVWMPRQLKEQLYDDLKLACETAGCPDLLDMIADEQHGTDLKELRAFLESKNHPALSMWDITAPGPELAAWDTAHPRSGDRSVQAKSEPVQSAPDRAAEQEAIQKTSAPRDAIPPMPGFSASAQELLGHARKALSQIATGSQAGSEKIMQQLARAASMISDAAAQLEELGRAPKQTPPPSAAPVQDTHHAIAADSQAPPAKTADAAFLPRTFACPADTFSGTVTMVTLGGSGTRRSKITIGGAGTLPLRHFEGATGHPPAVAMEVFDVAPQKFPELLRDWWADAMNDPAAMAKACVERHGAQAISIRLDGCHPERQNRTPHEAVDTVKAVLDAVSVPCIVTGTSHFEKNNEIMKKIAAECSGENLLLNWVESDNYRTITGACMGYDHCCVTRSPIDVNMAKQLNILVTAMGLKGEKIVMDPMTGGLGYGLEYTYSVMERIRLAGLSGDPMLQPPMLVTTGFETAKCKEALAPQASNPLWGDLGKRGALLETAAAIALINAGADLLIMYYPVAVEAVLKKIAEMTGKGNP
ncbi:MAG: CO dehydrogenase/CO-methylating acetyl-CoA synthase complex subunit beta [Chitinispirillaceae bacterium]|nr:CO dehydrogenase/CO-methylating acetyl-CoA synthase complex subunit beta [Chitinispirillaceae bacterium]